ncbi:acyl-CoA dehydrogenase/oxidase [Penicillium macrosclerotiorum]|uniref:acyl-CoA dehydrogenase/oxidase n=1 Tax=Penicillium macrosclerotiorum TaxID=303699 RepID=UPI002547C0B7|nr:acyl-CoA dehydrogenase/oxidase [Penicillium macrosclerotiorum]KAJ5689859.1 acyl-CoA dehydrogenase/oxidase [Penicillium macrosclerotiorum]
MSSVSLDLARSNLFKTPLDNLTQDEKISLGYQQARAAARAFGITIDDILNLTPKFWAYHSDPIHGVSYASLVLVTIQYNLVAGTIGPYLAQRPDLKGLMESVMNFDVNGQFLLTEIGHGLDTQSIETTATLLDDGCFDLHSPTPEAAKYMPPTTPVKGFPRFALVIARLIVAGEFHGLRAFIVWLNDGERMNNGVTSKRVPNRLGAKPIDHSITFFNHVRLPSSALLGSIEKPKNMRTQFLSVIWRVMVGSLSLPTMLVPLMKRAVYVAGKYSIRRHIHDNHGGRVPIISFRTQQQPILHTLAKTKVFEPFIQECIRMFRDPSLDKNVRHGIGAIAKAVLCSAFQESLFGLAERCGSQGLFHYNHIIENYMEGWGASIAEGDVLVLCISESLERHPSRQGSTKNT